MLKKTTVKVVERVTGDWIEQLVGGAGKRIRLEMDDGAMREGWLSGLTTRSINFNFVDVLIPIELEINGDPRDRVPLERIVRAELSYGLPSVAVVHKRGLLRWLGDIAKRFWCRGIGRANSRSEVEQHRRATVVKG